MHWTIENPRREIPRQTPLAQIDIRRWEVGHVSYHTGPSAVLSLLCDVTENLHFIND